MLQDQNKAIKHALFLRLRETLLLFIKELGAPAALRQQ